MTIAINDEDRRAAWTVFNYEREMYFALRDLVFPSRPSPLGKAANNAITESLVLHARNLCDMICDTTSFASREIGSAHLMPGLPEDFVEARTALSMVYLGGEHMDPSVPYLVFRHGLGPHLSRGENYDYSDCLHKIHEPLRWAMALIVAAKASENIQAARAKMEAEKMNEAVEEAKAAVGMDRDHVQATTEEFRRCICCEGDDGHPVYIAVDLVFSVHTVTLTGNRPCTAVFSHGGKVEYVRETPEEVVAKLEGRA